jgi:hypothetical protein
MVAVGGMSVTDFFLCVYEVNKWPTEPLAPLSGDTCDSVFSTDVIDDLAIELRELPGKNIAADGTLFLYVGSSGKNPATEDLVDSTTDSRVAS